MLVRRHGAEGAGVDVAALFCLCLLSVWVAGCETERVQPSVRIEPLRIELSGCAQIPAEGVCELAQGARDLTVFVPAASARVTVDAQVLAPLASDALQGGLRLRLRVPRHARKIELHTAAARARIMIRESNVPDRMTQLRTLRKRGELAALAAALDAWEAELVPAVDARCDRARLLGMRARLAFSRGEPHRVDALYEKSIPALLACGRLSEAVDDAMAQAYTRYEQLRDFAGAHATLAGIESQLRPYPWGAASVAYHRAFLSMRLGNLGRAIKQLDEAERGAERLGADDLRSISLQLRSWVLSLLGRHEQAAASIEKARVLSALGAPCERAALLTNLGWQRVLAKEAGHAARDARGPLSESVALLDTQCSDRAYRAHARVNLARLAVAEGALEEAARHLQRAAQDAPTGDGALQVALLDVQGRLLLDAGDARAALTVYEELSTRLRAAGESLPVGALGRAKALLALRKKEQAIEALRESEDELELQIATVSLGAGRESMSLGRGESAWLLVRTLVELGRADEAFLAARRARARLLWSLQRVTALTSELPAAQLRARERAIASYYSLRQGMDALAKGAWTLPKDEIVKAERAQREQRMRLETLLEDLFPAMRVRPAPRVSVEGQLTLGLFPLGDDLFVFASDRKGVRAMRRASTEAPESLLAALATELATARSLSVIGPSQGPLARIHTVLFGAQKLGLTRPVQYVVDLPRSTAGGTEGVGHLFVFDPRNDLHGARKEAAWLKQRRPAEEQATWLIGADATRERVLASFANTQIMHYAGHAAYDDDAWWESGLTLADRSTLTVSDILAAPAVPRHVVLAACATAKARAARHVATMGIAHAFIAAGAGDVVATLESIEDSLAFAFTRAYHASASEDAALRLQRASLLLNEVGLDWGAFVLLVP